MTQLYGALTFTSIAVVFLALFLVPGALVVQAISKRCPIENESFVIASATISCGLGYAIFWAYFANFILGRVVATTLLILSFFACFRFYRLLKISEIREPVMTWLGAMLFYGGLLGVYAQGNSYFYSAQTVLTQALPTDNWLPFELARAFFYGHAPIPFVGDWLSSDRPPLQAGIFLIFDPLASLIRRNDFFYQVVGMGLQLLWVPALWTLSRKFKLSRQVWIQVFLAALTSSFFLVNSIYVWPKLLGASLLIFGLILLVFRERDQAGLYVGSMALMLAFLSHGSAAFALLAIPVFFMLQPKLRKAWSWTDCMKSIGTMAMIYAPWSFYQKFYDPPGNRLLKWYLAGVTQIDTRGTFETIISQYRTTDLSLLLQNRLENLSYLFNWNTPIFLGPFTAEHLQSNRINDFFYFFNELGFYCLAVGAVFKWRKISSGVLSLVCYVIAGMCIWCGILFEAKSTSIHQGSYAFNVLLYFCAVVMLNNLSRKLAWIILSWRIVYFILLWVIFPERAFLLNTLSYSVVAACGLLLALKTVIQEPTFLGTSLSLTVEAAASPDS